jgi:hypothetical protein
MNITYPLRIVNGTLAVTQNTEGLVLELIRSVVATDEGERVLRPLYGSAKALFDTGYRGNLGPKVRDQLRDLPQVSFLGLSETIGEEGRVDIEVLYGLDDQVRTLTL